MHGLSEMVVFCAGTETRALGRARTPSIPCSDPLSFIVFEISVQTEFAAAHALSIGGVRETVHGHNWHVTVTLTGDTVDSDGLLCDFHTVEASLRELTERFHNRNLNDVAPFSGTVNPTAENVARYLAEELSASLDADLAPNAAIASVRVTEAPGCAATYRLPSRLGGR